MELTIRAESAEAAGALRAALERAGDFDLTETEDGSVAVVAEADDGPALAAALSGWLQSQPPGSGMSLETGTQALTLHAGDPRAVIALTEAIGRESRAAQPGEQSGG
jgi:hypothetical protein